MLLFFLEIIYPKIPGALAPQDFLHTALPEDILSLYAKYLINLSVWTGGILALAGLIYGGVLYLISTGKPDQMVLAKNQISAAFFGLLILLSSYLILKTLSPQFINLKIPALKLVEITVKPDVPLPETTAVNSSIDVEMPFARIIEKIFETYISDYPKAEEEETPRMIRIKEIVETTKEITNRLLNQSEALKSYSDACVCFGNTLPDPSCWHGGCGDCPPEYCTCDPCRNVRGGIQSAEDKNEEEINNLGINNTEIEQEVRLLKEELDRLKRAEKFIKECPLRSLKSLVQFYNKKDLYNNQGWTIRETKFWDDVNIQYYTGEYAAAGGMYAIPTEKIAFDFATFYCSVSGTMEQEEAFPMFVPEEDEITGEEVFSESMACSNEAPVGEIIDRTKRTTQLLIYKLELLVGKNKELIDAVDKLQVLVSKCSSRRCHPVCECHCSKAGCWCIEIGCFGIPCPIIAISNQLNEVQRIQREIKDIIDGKGSNDTPSNIGVITIIDEIAPEIIKDLAKNIRYTMRHYDKIFNCSQAKGAIIPPNNAVLRICCKTEGSAYGNCFEKCYLEKGQEEHRRCVQECLNGLGDPEIAQCTHELNFYICEQN